MSISPINKLPLKLTMPYAQARAHIPDGALIFICGRGFFSRLIRWATRSDYSHVGIAAWLDGGLYIIEMDGAKGVLTPLSQYAGIPFDVLSVAPESECFGKTKFLHTQALLAIRYYIPYNWWDIARIGASKILPFYRPQRRYHDKTDGKICSTFAASVYFIAGIFKTRATGIPTPIDVARRLVKDADSVICLQVRGS